MAWLLEKTYQRSTELQQSGLSTFVARNNMQVFYAQSLSIVYAQVTRVERLFGESEFTLVLFCL